MAVKKYKIGGFWGGFKENFLEIYKKQSLQIITREQIVLFGGCWAEFEKKKLLPLRNYTQVTQARFLTGAPTCSCQMAFNATCPTKCDK